MDMQQYHNGEVNKVQIHLSRTWAPAGEGGGVGVSAPREVVGVWGRGRDMGAIEEPLPKLQRGSLVFNPLSM